MGYLLQRRRDSIPSEMRHDTQFGSVAADERLQVTLLGTKN